jgi:hypothetical protein
MELAQFDAYNDYLNLNKFGYEGTFQYKSYVIAIRNQKLHTDM